MTAPMTPLDLPDPLPFHPTESIGDSTPVTSPLLLHTPGPIPPVDDDDDDEDEDTKGGGKGGNIDPDDDEDLDDDEDDDEADKQWASRRDTSPGGADPRFVL